MRKRKERKNSLMKKSKKLLLCVVILLIISVILIIGYVRLQTKNRNLSMSLESAKSEISEMKFPEIGQKKDGVIYLSTSSKVYYSFENALDKRDSAGGIQKFLPTLAEKKLLVSLNGDVIGVIYKSSVVQTTADGKSSTLYILDKDLYVEGS